MKKLSPFLGFCALILIFSTQTNFSCSKGSGSDTGSFRIDTVYVNDTVFIKGKRVSDLRNGLVAYYNFNDGTLEDSRGLNNHIVFNNATPVADRFGRSGNAFYFNGSGHFMRVANSASLTPAKMTLMATVKVDGFYGGLCRSTNILQKGDSDQ